MLLLNGFEFGPHFNWNTVHTDEQLYFYCLIIIYCVRDSSQTSRDIQLTAVKFI